MSGALMVRGGEAYAHPKSSPRGCEESRVEPLPSFLANEDLQLILFGGKGGMGKTTAAAATAVYLAKARRNKKILVVSTDPAHSLEDSFGCPIGGQTTTVPGIENLWALEIAAERSLAEFEREHGEVMHTLAHRGTYFDKEDIAGFFSLSLPGLDEVMAIIELANILGSGRFDVIILDTAPTGHTVRLLAQPEQMAQWVGVFDLMQEKHRYLFRHYTGRYVKDEADRFLARMSDDLESVRSLFRDARRTEFVPIAIPELLSIFETERLLEVLREHRIPVKTLLINRVAEERDCPFCRARSRDGQRFVREIGERFGDYHIIKTPLFPHEIRGLEGLRAFSEALVGHASSYCPPTPPEAEPARPSVKVDGDLSALVEKPLEFILFGGKGGVGKTTFAAATGLHLAGKLPNKKIVVFSTDPAHSLSDSFGCPIGDRITPIPSQGNLHAVEIDAAQLLEDFKQEYREIVGELFDRFTSRGYDIKFDRRVMTELIALAPPGLDEILALREIMALRRQGEDGLFILDTAPTGHLIRFLELPEIAREWLMYFLRLLIKYKGLVRLTQAAERLLDLSRRVRSIHETLTDSQKTEFVAVAIPEAMSVLETERLLQSLQRLKVPCHHLAINMVVPPTDCHFCIQKKTEQQRYMEELGRKGASGYRVSQVPMFPHEVNGVDDLAKVAHIMYRQ